MNATSHLAERRDQLELELGLHSAAQSAKRKAPSPQYRAARGPLSGGYRLSYQPRPWVGTTSRGPTAGGDSDRSAVGDGGGAGDIVSVRSVTGEMWVAQLSSSPSSYNHRIQSPSVAPNGTRLGPRVLPAGVLLMTLCRPCANLSANLVLSESEEYSSVESSSDFSDEYWVRMKPQKARGNQRQSEAIRGNQIGNQLLVMFTEATSETIRCNQAAHLRCNQIAIIRNHTQSYAIRRTQSDAIRRNQHARSIAICIVFFPCSRVLGGPATRKGMCLLFCVFVFWAGTTGLCFVFSCTCFGRPPSNVKTQQEAQTGASSGRCGEGSREQGQGGDHIRIHCIDWCPTNTENHASSTEFALHGPSIEMVATKTRPQRP
jgi:hypothetical protein